uniref:hypothetical protein n=1 Tax=Pseudodesulfovibrio pelocollis TaxID=3051432 RepID=UPI00255ADB06
MTTRFPLLLLLCLLLLSACKHPFGTFHSPRAADAVEFKYAPGSRAVRAEFNMFISMNGQEAAMAIPPISYEVEYTVEPHGDRLAWDVVLRELSVFGAPPDPGPFYSVTFTSDSWGNNKADIVIRETEVEDVIGVGAAILEDIGLPEGFFRVGDASVPINMGTMQGDKDTVLSFHDPAPAYVFTGTTTVDGLECYTFSFEDDKASLVMGGTSMPATTTATATLSKDMFPVSWDVSLGATDPTSGMITTYDLRIRMITKDAPDETGEAASVPLQTLLAQAPVEPFEGPLEFKYSPGSATYETQFGFQAEGVFVPVIGLEMAVSTSTAEENLAWDVSMSNVAVLGNRIDMHSSGFAYTTDNRGNLLSEISAYNPTREVPTKVQHVIRDFMLPTGSYRCGDVVMPLSSPNMEKIYTTLDIPDGVGYVLEGIQRLGDRNAIVLSVDTGVLHQKNPVPGLDRTASIKAFRHYDADTFLPLWFDTHIKLSIPVNGMTGIKE